MTDDEARAGRVGWAAGVAALYGVLAWAGTTLSLQLIGAPWWAGASASPPYLVVHPLRVLAIAVLAFGLWRVPVMRSLRALWVAVGAALLELAANWRDVLEWLRVAQLYWNGVDPRYHQFTMAPEATLWLGVPCAAGVLSTLLADWVVRRQSREATRGPTRS